jgi:predicted phage terminase large subunit-like protein
MVGDCRANDLALVGWAFEKGQIESAARPLIETSLAARGLQLMREMFPTRGDKAIRATSIRGRLGQTGIRYRNGLMQVDELINEMLAFPAAPHDDTVDAMGLVGQLLDKLRAGRASGLSVPGGTHAADGTPLPPQDAPEPEEGYIRLPMPGDWDRDRYRIRL